MSDVSIPLSGIAASASNSLRASVDSLGIDFPFSPGRPAGGDDTYDLPRLSLGLFYAVRVHHDNNDDSRDQADGVPPFFTVHCTLGEAYAERVVEHQLRPFERDAMLCLIALTLCRVPFDAHLYLQYCPYQHVKSMRSSNRFGTFEYRTRGWRRASSDRRCTSSSTPADLPIICTIRSS